MDELCVYYSLGMLLILFYVLLFYYHFMLLSYIITLLLLCYTPVPVLLPVSGPVAVIFHAAKCQSRPKEQCTPTGN